MKKLIFPQITQRDMILTNVITGPIGELLSAPMLVPAAEPGAPNVPIIGACRTTNGRT